MTDEDKVKTELRRGNIPQLLRHSGVKAHLKSIGMEIEEDNEPDRDDFEHHPFMRRQRHSSGGNEKQFEYLYEHVQKQRKLCMDTFKMPFLKALDFD